jgi:hypothetical protein
MKDTSKAIDLEIQEAMEREAFLETEMNDDLKKED